MLVDLIGNDEGVVFANASSRMSGNSSRLKTLPEGLDGRQLEIPTNPFTCPCNKVG
jgi:hypothetical protein